MITPKEYSQSKCGRAKAGTQEEHQTHSKTASDYMITGDYTVNNALETFALAPIRQTELLPTVLPLIIGVVVIELYFGKHTNEELGWNTAVGNSISWMSTGLMLLITTETTQQERLATYGIIGAGALLAYLDFYHKLSDTVAFIVSSSGIVYTLAYISVIMIKTSMPVNTTTLKAAGIFVISVNIGFKIIQSLETPQDSYALN